MKVLVLFAAVCIFALVLPQASAEKETAAHVVKRGGKGETLVTELSRQLFN